MRKSTSWFSVRLGGFVCGVTAVALVTIPADSQKLVLKRGEATVLVEPYAPNIVRVSLSLIEADALATAGYGFSAKAQPSGWTVETGASGDVLRSPELIVTVSPQDRKGVPTGTAADIAKFFNGSTPGVDLSIRKPDGTVLLQMQSWQMSVPNHKDGNADILYDRRQSDPPFYQVGATFAAATDEHDYGLGQNQEGYLDRRGHVLRCAHDYNAPSGTERARWSRMLRRLAAENGVIVFVSVPHAS